MSFAPGHAKRSRAQTVIDNDRAIREALASVTLESGWDAVTFSGVAKRAGLTVGAVYGRADSIADLGVDVWEADAGPWLRVVVDTLLSAARTGDPERIAAGFATWDAAPAMAALVAELLTAALFDVDLAEVVIADARETLGAPCTPAGGIAPSEAAAAALILSFAFGRLLASRRCSQRPELDERQLAALSGYFAAATSSTPGYRPPRLCWRRTALDPDAQIDSLLNAALDVVGRVGFKRATISRIARSAKVPRGSVLSHHVSKVALLADAAHRGLVTPMDVWLQYEPVVDQFGPLVSRALFLRDFLAADNAANWAINLELARLAQFEPALAEFRASDNVLEQTHLGVMLLAAVVPGLDELPFTGPFMVGSAT